MSSALLVAGYAHPHSDRDEGLSLGAQSLQNLPLFAKRVLCDKRVTQAEFAKTTTVSTDCLAAAAGDHGISELVGAESSPVYVPAGSRLHATDRAHRKG